MKKDAVATFSKELGYAERLVKAGLLNKDGTPTDFGMEILVLHGLTAPVKAQEDRVIVAGILATLASRGPVALHEISGDYKKRVEILRRFRVEGLVEARDGKYQLTKAGVEVAANYATIHESLVVERRPQLVTAEHVLGRRPQLDFFRVLRRGDATDNARWALLKGHVLDRLRSLPDGCVDLVVTSPPYWKYRNYGEGQMGNEKTIQAYVAGQVEVLQELKRVLGPRGVIWYVVEDKVEGGEVFGIAHELIVEIKRKTGLILSADMIWAKDATQINSAGKSVSLAHEYMAVFAKTTDCYWDRILAREYGGHGTTRNLQSVQRFPHKKESWQDGHDAVFPVDLVKLALRCNASFYGRCWCGEPFEHVVQREQRSDENKKRRTAVKRKAKNVAPRCGHVGDPEPLLILDPFCGSGTSGVVSLMHGKARFIGIENNPDYFAQGARNLAAVSGPEQKGK